MRSAASDGRAGAGLAFCSALSMGRTAFSQTTEAEDFIALSKKACRLHDQDRIEEALPVALDALKLADRAGGPDHPWTASALSNVARLYLTRGQRAEAEPLLKRALAIREKLAEPDEYNVGRTLGDLGALYCHEGRQAEAEPLLLRALAIYEKHLGADHPYVCALLNSLAALCQADGRADEAERLLRRSLAIRLNVVGDDGLDTAGESDQDWRNCSFRRIAFRKPLNSMSGRPPSKRRRWGPIIWMWREFRACLLPFAMHWASTQKPQHC